MNQNQRRQENKENKEPETKNKGNQQKIIINMLPIEPTMLIITWYVQSIPINRLSGFKKLTFYLQEIHSKNKDIDKWKVKK